MRKQPLLAVALVSSLLAACGGSSSSGPCDGVTGTCVAIDAAATETVISAAFVQAAAGSTIAFPAGTFTFKNSLNLASVKGVTIKGAGIGQTILDFSTLVGSGEGIVATATDNLLFVDFTARDTKGNGIKVVGSKGVTWRRVQTIWTSADVHTHGAYGLYPVQSHYILIENCEVAGAADAGIYVGQSHNVIVRGCRAEQNVAGIEIENTIDADVHDNVATGNTGGILVFNMPNLSQPGHSTRVFHNKVDANNLGNFGAKGTAVSSVPAGSGVVVNSNSLVEIFDNDVTNNVTANVIISSYFSTGYFNTKGVQPGYDPYPRGIAVHDNRFAGGGDSPDGMDLKVLKTAMFGLNGHFPDVLWDGYVDAKRPDVPEERLCVDATASGVLNADGPNKYKDPRLVGDALRCKLAPLAPVTLAVAAPAKS